MLQTTVALALARADQSKKILVPHFKIVGEITGIFI
jgi:hypothetical protein